MKSATSRTAGSVALKRLGLTQQQIAERLGSKGHTTVLRWMDGSRRPGKPARAKLLAEFKIPLDAWDKPAGGAKKPPKTKAPAPERPAAPTETATVRSRALKLGRMVDGLLAEVADDSTPAERAKVLDQAARTLAVLGKLTGESGDVTIPTILASPHWRRLEDTIIAALEPWPDAARAVADAIVAIG